MKEQAKSSYNYGNESDIITFIRAVGDFSKAAEGFDPLINFL